MIIDWNISHVVTHLHTKSNPCSSKNSVNTSSPKVNDTPRSDSFQPELSAIGSLFVSFRTNPSHFRKLVYLRSGSLQSRSHSSPSSGTSHGRRIWLIWSKSTSSCERPPCIHRILSSIIAATGNVLKTSPNLRHNLMECLRLHSS